MKNKVDIIGVSPYGVSCLIPKARRLIKRADILFGGQRLLDQFAFASADKIALGHNLQEILNTIRQNLGKKRMVVLASGDPNLYGIADYLISRLGKDAVEIIPNISSMQVAFALIKETWEDVFFFSVHGRNPDSLAEVISAHQKIGVFTDESFTPARIAGILLENGLTDYTAYICQDLGSSRQKILCSRIEELSRTNCSPLNVMILLRDPGEKQAFNLNLRKLGIPDEDFFQRKPQDGLITKQEIRLVTLGKMSLHDNSLVWDIGAGSGAVSIEASRIAGQGRVIAIEKNEADVGIIKKNMHKFGRNNITIVHRRAPEGLDELPSPSSIFIGGSDGEMEAILQVACRRLQKGGKIVVNAATLETLQAVQNGLKKNGFIYEITQINISRSKDLRGLIRLEPLNPVFIIAGQREEDLC